MGFQLPQGAQIILCKRDGCEKTVLRKPNVYCSYECSALDRVGKSRSRDRVLKICLNKSCHKEFSIIPSNPKKYCSRSCSRVGNSNRSLTPGGKKFTPLDGSSPYSWRQICRNVYCQTPARHPSLFCSLGCKTGQETLEKSFEFVITGHTRLSSPSPIKSLLLFIRGFICEMSDCEIAEWKGKPVPLVMDHIDGNSEDDSYSNLRLICGNCDMLLPTYKSKNIGNGRKYRRDRYAQGLSY